jgi:hypothetical protein
MSRKKRKTSKDEVDSLYQRCQYCKAHRGARFFNRHEAACKARWIIRNETHQHQSTTTVENSSTIQLQYHLPEGFMEGCSEMRQEDTIMDPKADQLDVSGSRDSSELVEPNLSEQNIL